MVLLQAPEFLICCERLMGPSKVSSAGGTPWPVWSCYWGFRLGYGPFLLGMQKKNMEQK